ncbi:MAG: RecBCD enzyme subunit RecC [Candidatus Erwinia impunctatus]|nr:RecBCD enzyme subunit RecC [Culicoides impunctatus]
MFTVYHSNQLALLKMLASSLIAGQPLRDPFQSEVVLVQSPGMAQWLQIELAEQFGIAANITFPLPATFIWDMFVTVLPGIPKESAFTKSAMSWKLMAILPEKLANPGFTLLKTYLSDDSDQRKLFQLASRIADLFDQYLVYRADWLNLWQQGKRVSELGDEQEWQAVLWCELVEYTERHEQPKWHRANLYAQFISTLENSTECPAGLPDRVFICGISALPPVYLQALQALGKHIDIHLLFTNPCRHYWGDIQDYAFLAKLQSRRRQHYTQGHQVSLFDSAEPHTLFNEQGEQQLSNPLLASWGKLGRDNLYLLAQAESLEIDAFVDIDPDTLLRTVQRDLLELEDHAVIGLSRESWSESSKKRLLRSEDDSLRVHVCHSPQREVEILQDCLLDMMVRDPELAPRDIIVMVADVDAYTPFIQSVFGSTPSERYVPFSISDRSAAQMHPVIQAFITLLGLPESRFTAEDVLTLLEVPALANRFSIDEEGLKRLRDWVVASGIRWGLDDDTMLAHSLPVTGQHTWQFGLTRMLLGYAMQSEAGSWRAVLPFDESSGLIAELAGHLAQLLALLHKWRAQLTTLRTLTEWLPLCRTLIDDFFTTDAEADAALTLLETQWQRLLKQGIEAGYQQPIPISLLRDDLHGRLNNERISQRFLAGPVNFCTLMPMRSIPFKVVCLLGMNDGIYPRTLPPLGFDLMSQKPRKGDRSRRDDDRYLFLEALNAAQHRLYISYIGRSVQDNTPRFPSVLVSELLEYVSQSFCLPGDEKRDVDSSAAGVMRHLHIQHCRTPFAAENFIPQATFCSYASEWLPAAAGEGDAQAAFVQPLPALTLTELRVEQLIAFWRHPVRAFFRQRLGVTLVQEEDELPDTEPFTLDNLSRYQLNNLLLNALVEGTSTEQLYLRQRAAGHLPYGPYGQLFWQQQCDDLSELASLIRDQRQPGEYQEIALNIKGIILTGWLPDVQSDGLLRWRPGTLNFSDGLAVWIEHLVYCSQGGGGTSRMYGRQQSAWCFPRLSPEFAGEQLEMMIEGYLQGMSQPLLLPLKSAGAWISSCYDKQSGLIIQDEMTQQKAQTKFNQAWQGGYQTIGEISDPYLARLLRRMDEHHWQEIMHHATRWLLPLLQHHSGEET